MGRLKMRDWNYRHQTAGVENAGPSSYGKPKHLRDRKCRSYFLLVAVLCVAIYASLNRVIPETYSVVSAVVLIVREQTPLFATDISAFLSCAGSVRCPTLITALTVPQVGRDYSVLICLP